MWHVPPLPPHSHPHPHHLSTRPAFQPNLSKNYFKLCITYFKSHNFDSGLFFMCKGYCEKWKCMHYECRTTTRQTILQLQKKPWNEFYNDTFLFRASCKEYLVQFKLIIFVHCLLYKVQKQIDPEKPKVSYISPRKVSLPTRTTVPPSARRIAWSISSLVRPQLSPCFLSSSTSLRRNIPVTLSMAILCRITTLLSLLRENTEYE